MDEALRFIQSYLPRTCSADRTNAATRTPGRVGSQLTRVSRRLEGHGGARSLGQGAERARAEYSLVPRWLGRPWTIEPNTFDLRRCRRFPGRYPDRQKSALRHPRACHGSDCERALRLEAQGLRSDILYLQRLCTARHSALCADGTAVYFRVHS